VNLLLKTRVKKRCLLDSCTIRINYDSELTIEKRNKILEDEADHLMLLDLHTKEGGSAFLNVRNVSYDHAQS
jgi:hypothetical protein